MKQPAFLLLVASAPTGAACGQGSSGGSQTKEYTLVDYMARWDGYAEAFTFNDGSDRVRLVLDASGNGTLEVGDRPPVPPVTDPAAGPPGDWNLPTNHSFAYLRPGFRYPVYEPRVEAKRLRLGADYHDSWRDWCGMQTPTYSELAGRHTCSPDVTTQDASGACYFTDPATQTLVPMDCLRYDFCQMPSPCSCGVSPMLCECTATSCEAPRRTAAGAFFVKIDAALEEDATELVGTLAIDDIAQRFTIRLTRQ